MRRLTVVQERWRLEGVLIRDDLRGRRLIREDATPFPLSQDEVLRVEDAKIALELLDAFDASESGQQIRPWIDAVVGARLGGRRSEIAQQFGIGTFSQKYSQAADEAATELYRLSRELLDDHFRRGIPDLLIRYADLCALAASVGLGEEDPPDV